MILHCWPTTPILCIVFTLDGVYTYTMYVCVVCACVSSSRCGLLLHVLYNYSFLFGWYMYMYVCTCVCSSRCDLLLHVHVLYIHCSFLLWMVHVHVHVCVYMYYMCVHVHVCVLAGVAYSYSMCVCVCVCSCSCTMYICIYMYMCVFYWGVSCHLYMYMYAGGGYECVWRGSGLCATGCIHRSGESSLHRCGRPAEQMDHWWHEEIGMCTYPVAFVVSTFHTPCEYMYIHTHTYMYIRTCIYIIMYM